MTERGPDPLGYDKIKAILCTDCPLRPTCPQFKEQLDACADALFIQSDDEADLGSFTQFMARYDEEG